MIKFKGMGVALVTPFKTDFSVDYDALERIVEYNIENGTNYLVVMGTTAESATLSESEKKTITQFILKKNNGRLPLVLGIGGNNTAAVVNELKTTNLDGIDAILSVSPYYNKPTQEGIFQHFKAVAAATTKPIIIYNVPGRTASNILPSTVVKIANEIPNVIAIKEAAGDIVQAMQLIKDAPKDFLIISGDDMIALPMILAGGSGVISVIGEGFPEVFSKMVQLGLEGKTQEAYKLHYKTMHAIELIFREGNPAGIKAVFEALNLSTSVVRLPLISASNKLKQDIQEVVSNFNA